MVMAGVGVGMGGDRPGGVIRLTSMSAAVVEACVCYGVSGLSGARRLLHYDWVSHVYRRLRKISHPCDNSSAVNTSRHWCDIL